LLSKLDWQKAIFPKKQLVDEKCILNFQWMAHFTKSKIPVRKEKSYWMLWQKGFLSPIKEFSTYYCFV